MIFNIKQFLDDFGIPNTDRGKHARTKWIQIKCPFCSGHEGWHGGFNIEKEYYNCWRCGWRSLPDIIMELLGCSFPAAKTYLKKYKNKPESSRDIGETRRLPSPQYKGMTFPPNCQSLSDFHRKYLLSRNFDPDDLIHEWNLKGTSHLGDYRFRIIAPIYFQNQFVSYQGRDVTDRQEAKYKACEMENEILHHKHTLYGIDKTKNKSVIIVEGITDVWRFGPGAVGTFGIEFTKSQVRMLLNQFESYFVFFDDDPQAQAQADKLAIILNGFGKDVEIISTEDDPANMSQKDARQLKSELLSN